MESYQLVNQTYKNFKDSFAFDPEKGGLHNFLWEILVKQKFADQTVALTVVVMDGNELAVASEKGGYFKTGLRFVNPDYNAATPILNDLNQIVFGLSKDEADQIIMKSMKADIDE